MADVSNVSNCRNINTRTSRSFYRYKLNIKVHFDVVMTMIADTLYSMLAKKLRGFEEGCIH
jgi:hypothetical protein